MFWFWTLLVTAVFVGISLHTPFTPIYAVPLFALYLAYSTKRTSRAQWVLPLVMFAVEAVLIGWQTGFESYASLGTQAILFATLTIIIFAIVVGRMYREDARNNCAQFLNFLILFTVVIWLYITAIVWVAFYPGEPILPLYYASAIGDVLDTLTYNLVFIISLWLVPLPKEF